MLRLILFGFILKLVNGQDEVCTSEVCQTYSERLKANIDSSVSPCDDFYKVSFNLKININDLIIQ